MVVESRDESSAQIEKYKAKLEEVFLTQRIGGARRAELDVYALLKEMSEELERKYRPDLNSRDRALISKSPLAFFAPAVGIAYTLYDAVLSKYSSASGEQIAIQPPVLKDKLHLYGSSSACDLLNKELLANASPAITR